MAVKVTTKPSMTAADLIGGTSSAPGATALRSGLGKTEYRKLVKTLHGKGIAVGTFDPGTPLSLQPRTQTSLRSQAANTINSSYAPAETALNDSERRVNAISAKRQSDMASYQGWAERQMGQIQASSQAASDSLVAKQKEIASTFATAQAASNASLLSGMTPDQQATFLASHPANAISAATNGNVAVNNALGAAAAAPAQVANRAASLAGSIAGTNAQLQAGDRADLAKIQDQRSSLLAEKGAKGADLLDKLIQQESTNASTVQQTKAAASALGVKQDQFNATLKSGNANKAADRVLKAKIAGMADETKRAAQSLSKAQFVADYGGLDPAKVLAGGYTQKQLVAAHKTAKGSGKGSAKKPIDDRSKELQARTTFGHSLAWVLDPTRTQAQLNDAMGKVSKAKGGSQSATPTQQLLDLFKSAPPTSTP